MSFVFSCTRLRQETRQNYHRLMNREKICFSLVPLTFVFFCVVIINVENFTMKMHVYKMSNSPPPGCKTFTAWSSCLVAAVSFKLPAVVFQPLISRCLIHQQQQPFIFEEIFKFTFSLYRIKNVLVSLICSVQMSCASIRYNN